MEKLMSRVFAYQNIKSELFKSSSGGAFIALCKAFENLYGKENIRFVGASFDKDLNVIHEIVNTVQECRKFQGSKYVESRCDTVFVDIKQALQEGFWVLFSGTPCQVYRLQSYLFKEKVNLTQICFLDIICHGTPETQVWEDYRKWLEQRYKSKLIKYSFRYKPEGWRAYPAYAKFENGKELIHTAGTSVYAKLYMKGYITAKKCFQCPFAKKERESDITLGDYWGIEHLGFDFSIENGVSLLLIHTKKGENLINELCKDRDRICIETAEREYLRFQHNLLKPTQKPEKYDEFWKDYKEKSFTELIKKYLNYGFLYKIIFNFKKCVRKTPFIKWYRKRKEKKD